MFVLAHLSDPHLAPLPKPRLAELFGKRVTGYLNWWRKRRALHRTDVLAAIVRDLKAQAPDHIAVTGDLVNISLAAEFAPAHDWLVRLGAPAEVTLIPGNHDTYVRAAAHAPERYWGDYMRGDGAAADATVAFPFVRRRGPLALIGLSTAVPTAPFKATGTLGDDQIERLADTLARLADKKIFRVVLIHHPPISAPGREHKHLTDAPDFREALRRHGAELVLHGHDHVHLLNWLDGPKGRIPAVGVPSASAAPSRADDPAAYNLYRIENAQGAWRCEMISRGFHPAGASAGELRRQRLC
jgi:3',5'-cyclic AMP phosphodiesterase CpdA